MKSFTSLLAIAALSFATCLFAQEESPAPAPEEKASATVEVTPTPTPETKAPASTEQSTATSPDVKKKEVPTAAKKESAAAATPSKKAAASTTADKGSPESNVKRLEDEWEASIMRHDPSFAQTRVAEDFLGCSSKGKTLNKSGLLKEFKSDKDTYTSVKNRGLTVRNFGPNIAIATGSSHEVGTDKDGKKFDRNFRWTDTWVLRGSQWQCIGSHVMAMEPK